MTKIKRSITINADLDNAIGRLATVLDQSNSQLIENILRKHPKIDMILNELQMAEEMPDYIKPELKRKVPAL